MNNLVHSYRDDFGYVEVRWTIVPFCWNVYAKTRTNRPAIFAERRTCVFALFPSGAIAQALDILIELTDTYYREES